MKTLVAIPCMDMVHTAFMQSLLSLRPVGETNFALMASSLIYDARNNLAKQAIDQGYDRILWLDSDMTFGPDLLERLSADLDEGREYVAALFFRRKQPVSPCIYNDYGYNKEGREIIPYINTYEDYPMDCIFEVEASGLAGVMMKVDLLKKVFEEYGAPFSPQPGFGEDISFCIRARTAGHTLYCDSRIKMGHIGQIIINEETYKKVEKR